MTREPRTVADTDADRLVARALRARAGKATIGDLVVASGLPEHATRRSVDRLLDEYEGSVGVADGGELIYRFKLGVVGLIARRERRRLWAAFTRASATIITAVVTALRAAFRAVLAVQLLFYLILILTPISVIVGVVIGIVILITLIIAAISDGGDVGGLIEVLFNPYVMGVVLVGCVLVGIFMAFTAKVGILMAVVGKDEAGRTGLSGFIAQVNDFALGPEKPPTRAERIDRAWPIRQADEQRVLARIRAQGGRLRAGDLVAWLGMDLEEAERQAARIAVEYDGEPSATDLEVVEFQLGLLMKTAGSETKGAEREPTTYERGVSLPRFTGNLLKEDLVIAGFAVANLAGGFLASRWMTVKAALAHAHVGWWKLGAWVLGNVPAAFSLLLFALFVIRIPGVTLVRWLRGRRRRRQRIHDAIVAHARAKGDAPLDLATLDDDPALVREIALGLEGQFDLEGDAERTVWRWRRLARELSRERARDALTSVEDEGEPGLGD